jgi:hypothetical protein
MAGRFVEQPNLGGATQLVAVLGKKLDQFVDGHVCLL